MTPKGGERKGFKHCTRLAWPLALGGLQEEGREHLPKKQGFAVAKVVKREKSRGLFIVVGAY